MTFPTTDQLTALASCGPSPREDDEPFGPHLQDVVTWFRQLQQVQSFSLLGIGKHYVDVCFDQPMADSETVENRVQTLCAQAHDRDASAHLCWVQPLPEKRCIRFRWDRSRPC